MRVVLALSLFAASFAPAARAGGDDTPQWLRALSEIKLPSYDKRAAAAVLLNEETVTVEEGGKVVTSSRYAVRILSREGRHDAVAAKVYLTDTGKVRDLRAWLLKPSGEVKKYGKDRVADVAAAQNDVYNEVRVRVISAADEVEAGAVFGYEATVEEKSVFTQFEWEFQERLPVLASRFTLNLPNGWEARGVTYNHAPMRAAVNGSSYTWELRDLPFIEREPASPRITALAPRLAVSFFAPPGAKAGIGKSFANWADVSRWLTELHDPQSLPNDDINAKARDLTANAKTDFERVEAIGKYVQGIKYVAVQTGIGRGGGYRPHPAATVFAKSYGDCKDKANLMRAMLRSVGITAYPVAIYSGDPTYVREDFASPQQFNHCIVAAKIKENARAHAILQHPSLGPLLIFDATDEDTPVGELPEHEQNSFALIVAGDRGSLLRMPVTPADANRLERETDITLKPDGSIEGALREKAYGQAAADSRAQFRHESQPEFAKSIERWIVHGVPGAAVLKLEPLDNGSERQFHLAVQFASPHYAQIMQGRLMVFKPAVVSRRESLFLTEAKRQYPIVLRANSFTDTVRIKLPGGFVVDEIPEAAKLQTAFGSYATSYAVKDDLLIFTRVLKVQAGILPVEQYGPVKDFFEQIAGAEQAPVVLARK